MQYPIFTQMIHSERSVSAVNIEILQLLEGARRAKGLTVIIDVFRAFSVECYALAAGASAILATGDIDEAYRLQQLYPDAYLVGERGGMKCEGFHFGNSPSELSKADLSGRMIIHTTSAGTQGIANAYGADEIITGSLVNAAAAADYIRRKSPEHVSLVCMGLSGKEETAEDTLCAVYIKALLEGRPIDISDSIHDLRRTSGRKFFDPVQQQAFPQPDFGMCTQLNLFPFVIRANAQQNYWRMERIDII